MKNTIHQKLARTVMGKNFFGVEDWLALYDANFSQEQLLQVAEFPWGEDILNSTCPLCGKVVKDCHFAFVGLDRINGKPLTILQLQKLHPATGQPRFYSYNPDSYDPDIWCFKAEFATETTMDFKWYLLHQNIVSKLGNRTFDGHKAMLTADYEVPSAITEVAKDLLVFQKTKNFVNSFSDACCEYIASEGGRIGIGSYGKDGENGLGVRLYSENTCHGVAASRKFPSTSSG